MISTFPLRIIKLCWKILTFQSPLSDNLIKCVQLLLSNSNLSIDSLEFNLFFVDYYSKCTKNIVTVRRLCKLYNRRLPADLRVQLGIGSVASLLSEFYYSVHQCILPPHQYVPRKRILNNFRKLVIIICFNMLLLFYKWK